jgi:recombination protein RecT
MAKKETDGANAQNATAQKETQLAAQQDSLSKRFSDRVQREFSGKAGTLILTNSQKRLIQNYFLEIDRALKMAEEKRLKKQNGRDPLEISWNTIDMEPLAIHVVACSRIGLDPAQPNHVSMMPFKNNLKNKYDIVFIEGYRGKELKAMKYGYDVPDDVIVELVYSNDTFMPQKKDKDNKVENYTFKVSANPFDRGEIIGGFYYHLYIDSPEKCKLDFFSAAEILKRKPKYASTEFWGGEKVVYDDAGKKTKDKEHVEGWYKEMMYKTVYRMAYSSITIDSQKIDDDFMRLLAIDRDNEERDMGLETVYSSREEAKLNANKEEIVFTDFEDASGKSPQQKLPDSTEVPKTETPEQKNEEQKNTEEPHEKQPEKQPENHAKGEIVQPKMKF